MDSTFLVTVSPRRADPFFDPIATRSRMADALARWPGLARRVRANNSQDVVALYVGMVPPAAMVALVTAMCRGEEFAVGVHLTAPAAPQFAALRIAAEAQRSQHGLAVRIDRGQAAFRSGEHAVTVALSTSMTMYAALLRGRSPRCWIALDAVAEHRTATAAAAALGCSQQAVSAHLKRSNHTATARILVVVETILAARERAPR